MTDRKALREMSLEELNKAVGGRLVRESEWDNYADVQRKVIQRARQLNKQDAQTLRNAFDSLFDQWLGDIGNAPEGSADILISDYMADKWI